ncbi:MULTISPECIES: NADH-quinone oxidoreductase subunit L [unclassified Roseitalea]|uniref:NADH-quinone oxidoreductase subunit L n=1 Tax=unclassified Roseitalea TaxID=2639107 RepID=UPI00273EA226|nr:MULTISPECIES: NADH-quinone oxidoreductase subunit L [unclassified Roseitalea]
MSPTLALFVLLAPLAHMAVWLHARRRPGLRPHAVLAASRWVSLATLSVAIVVALAVAAAGPVTSTLIGVAGLGLSVRLDALTAIIFLLVSFIGAIVIQYSRNYMDGDDRQGTFFGGLCLTLGAVMLLVLSGNLFQLVLAWIVTGLALRQLLLFYADRPAAIAAARKQFIVARIGDGALVLAALLLANAFGTADLAAIAAAASAGTASASIVAAAFLIALAALMQSAQFPVHGWLPEVMETPTPVSALLHAGIVNAGGFLIVRFADVMVLSAASLHLLALVGGFTALFGAVVMLTQTSIKVSLAWSTVAQMGFMILQCGLGAFALAVLHIVAHSLYKAHAFLSSGSVVEIARASWVPEKARPRAADLFAALATALALYGGIAYLVGLAGGGSLAVIALGAILIMGVTLMMAQAMAGTTNGYVIGRTAAAAAGVTVAYFALQAGATALLASVVPTPAPAGPIDIAIIALVIASFGLVTIAQILGPSRATLPLWRQARVHLSNGLYVNALMNRLTGAYRHSAANPS